MWDLFLQKRILSTKRRQSFDEKPWGKNGQVKDTSFHPSSLENVERWDFLTRSDIGFRYFACEDLIIFGFISFRESNKRVFYDEREVAQRSRHIQVCGK
ncbi:hypothetical protein CEXT_754251 [Caerostris extrusa]|uniref:Uncharacterized protein n=1 Tax=Caerostris extrusa TaxID=172846 RepID=A0AAV4UME1_CAEEX|nr:hypothetical protein CEXT_754251 [Caerostris extrusa]